VQRHPNPDSPAVKYRAIQSKRKQPMNEHESECCIGIHSLLSHFLSTAGVFIMDFRIQGLSPEPFIDLYGRSDEDLASRNAKRYVADAKPGFPDRIELRDVEPGESVILVNHVHQPANTPYRASHAIFVREGAEKAYAAVNEIPAVLQVRLISVRAFDSNHWMLDANACAGQVLDVLIRQFLSNPAVDYLQAHFAKPGCYAARIDRV
jgi:hypothetical protein